MTSSVSGAHMLADEAIRSDSGNHCLPTEGGACFWSEIRHHPENLRTCTLTGVAVHRQFTAETGPPRLRLLVELLDGFLRNADERPAWDNASSRVVAALHGGRCKIEAAALSPTGKYLVISCEVRTLLGLKISHVGAIYDLGEQQIVGRIAQGKRKPRGWTEV